MKYPELAGIGLTKSEILVYTSLLRIGCSSTGNIVKGAGISSGKIYEILDRLIEKGLVSYILKNNVKHFSASNPRKLEEYIKKKKQEIIEKEEIIKKLIPQLEELEKSRQEEYSVQIYMGFNGFKTAFINAIENAKPNTDHVAFGVSGKRRKEISLFFHRISPKMNEKKMHTRLIVTDDSFQTKQHMREYEKERKLEYKFLKGFYLAAVDVFEDITIIGNMENISAISIKSATVAKQFKFFFESLWGIAKKG